MKIMVAMSGGVDSSATAAMFLEQGYEVEGATFSLFDGNAAVGGAAEVCAKLGIRHHVLDLSRSFKEKVIDKFSSAYQSGVTPNPCIWCNQNVKFGEFYDWAMENGADYIATGHYARVEQVGDRYRILRALDKKKDQSYVFYTLSADKLAKLKLPLGYLTKDDARSEAAKSGIVIESGESQDICFIPDGDYVAYLARNGVTSPEGDFIGPDGSILGRHKGVVNYTVGQRKGLGISFPEALYVNRIDASENKVYLSDNESLFSNALIAGDVKITYPDELTEARRVKAKIRYGHDGEDATARILKDGRLLIEFDKPQRAITPGQSAVLYDGDAVIGGGIIISKAYAEDSYGD